MSRQQYNTKHVQRNKLSIAFKSRQLGKILKRLTNQKVVVVKHISLIKKEQNLVTESTPDASLLNTTAYNINQEDQKPVLAEVSQVQSVKKDIVTKRVSGIKTEILNVSLKTEVQSKNKITKAAIKHTDNKPEIERPEKKKNALYNMLPYNVTEVHDKSLSNLQLTVVNDKTMLPKTNKTWTFEEKTDVPDIAVKINVEPAKSEPQDLMTLKLANKTVKPIVVLQEEKIAESSLVINKNYGTAMDITSISGTIEEQIMEMVVNGNTDEIKMALEDGNSIGVLRVLLVNNISREDLTLTEKDTINDYIAILGKIGNKEDIKILSDIKVTNRKLDDYYTHNIYSAIWKLKKKMSINRIVTREDFDDAIDYISYIYNYYKINTDENMQLYNYEIDFLTEIIEAVSNSSYTQESVPLLAKLIEFRNKDFVNFVNKIIDNIFHRLSIENSTKVLADFRP